SGYTSSSPLIASTVPITALSWVASTIVYVSSLIVRNDTRAPGNSLFDQYARPSIECVSPASSSAPSTSRICPPNAGSSASSSGSSYAAQASCCARMYGLCGSTHAASVGRPNRYCGRRIRYWSTVSLYATSTTSDGVPLRPARPACCQMLASVGAAPISTATSSPPTSIPSSSAFVLTTPRSSPA